MAGTYLFDSNIFIDLLRGNKEIVEKVAQIDKPAIPATVIGELHFGAYLSGKYDQEVIKVDGLTGDLRVIPTTKKTAKIYAEIKYKLRKKGRPIPENDIWIAATAMQFDLTLITKDKHFKEIEGLKLELWPVEN